MCDIFIFYTLYTLTLFTHFSLLPSPFALSLILILVANMTWLLSF